VSDHIGSFEFNLSNPMLLNISSLHRRGLAPTAAAPNAGDPGPRSGHAGARSRAV